MKFVLFAALASTASAFSVGKVCVVLPLALLQGS